MFVRRFDRGYSRRVFLENSAKGLLRCGVLGSAWAAFARSGSVAAAFPDELLSIEEYTRGRLRPGDVIDARNVEAVKGLLDPVRYQQIAEMGRRLTLVPTTTDLYRLNPPPYVDATLRHRGKAAFDAVGNVVTTDGKPWIGGNPFPEPQSALEVFAAHTLSWGRHDAATYACVEHDLDEAGREAYRYASCWAEMATVGRTVLEPRPYLTGMADKVRLQAVFFLDPADMKGVGYLNTWPYDQTRFPELQGYLPAFKRVRQFPTNQRFETLNPGSELYLSDAWAAGDPFLTWGNYRVTYRGPLLGAVSSNWRGDHPDWEHRTHGGAHGSLFWDMAVELVPETIAIDAEPVRYPRAPVSRKRVWFDARTLLPVAMISFDRQGRPFRFFDGAYSVYDDGRARVMNGRVPYWSWTTIHAFNIQTRRMTRIEQVRALPGGHASAANDERILERYLTTAALQRAGA